MKGLTEGRIVHYHIAGHEYPGAELAKGQHRPLLVTKVWYSGCVNGELFVDRSNDGLQFGGSVWLTSVMGGAPSEPGRWHEVERVDEPAAGAPISER